MTAVNRLARDNNGQGVRLSQSRRPCDSTSGSCLIPAAEVAIQPDTSTPRLKRGSNLVICSATNHEAGVVVATSEAVSGKHDEFVFANIKFLASARGRLGCRTKI